MASKPVTLPVWNTSGANRVTPSGGLQASGYANGDIVASSELNWFKNLVYQWAAYLDDLAAQAFTWAGIHTFSNTVNFDSTADFDGAVDMSVGLNVTKTSGNALSVTGGSSDGIGLIGTGGTSNGVGVAGYGTGTGVGVNGTSNAANGNGVNGQATGTGIGVKGTAGAGNSGIGVSGIAGAGISGRGVQGTAGNANNLAGVYGSATHADATGVYAEKTTGNGTAAAALWAESQASGAYAVVCSADTTSPVRAALRIVPQNASPSSPQEGDVYYDSGTHKLCVYNGTTWNDLN